MPPSKSVVSHAANIIRPLGPHDRADQALRGYFERERRLSPAEKRVITRATFCYFRWLHWLDRDAPIHQQIEKALEIAERFERDPSSVKPETLAARAVPEWFHQEVDVGPALARGRLSADPAPPGHSAGRRSYYQQLQSDPALWIRARPGAAGRLAAALGDCHPTDRSPDALRYDGPKDLFRTDQFQAGEFEIQDLASQLVGLACAPLPGQTWWDACAGEGGKTLHLADQMMNKGLVWATDRSARRIESLKRRAARAKVFNYRTVLWSGGVAPPMKTKFDGILIDAPCSGVGTWQRNPHARWTTRLEDVAELAAIQLGLLESAANSLKTGGRLVYSVCTLTRSETTAIADAFTAKHPELQPSSVLSHPSSVQLWPQEINANGMFIAAWTKVSHAELQRPQKGND